MTEKVHRARPPQVEAAILKGQIGLLSAMGSAGNRVKAEIRAATAKAQEHAQLATAERERQAELERVAEQQRRDAIDAAMVKILAAKEKKRTRARIRSDFKAERYLKAPLCD